MTCSVLKFAVSKALYLIDTYYSWSCSGISEEKAVPTNEACQVCGSALTTTALLFDSCCKGTIEVEPLYCTFVVILEFWEGMNEYILCGHPLFHSPKVSCHKDNEHSL